MKIQENSQEKGRLLSKLARPCLVGCGFSPGYFPVFSPDAKHPAWQPKAAVPESDMRVEILDTHPERNSGNHAFSAHQVISVIVGAWASGPCRRARERAALESSPIPDKSQWQNETSSIPRGGRQLKPRYRDADLQLQRCGRAGQCAHQGHERQGA